MSADDLRTLDAYFRAANYLTVGQIYLQANPLLQEALRPEHIKPRLLGHWGTSREVLEQDPRDSERGATARDDA